MVLVFHRTLVFYPCIRVEMVTYASHFFRVGYVRVIVGSTSETKCTQKRKVFLDSLSEAVSLDMGFAHECIRETKPSSSPLPFVLRA